jgi:hypothetical protein
MTREGILTFLRAGSGNASASVLAENCCTDSSPESNSAIDMVCYLSPEITRKGFRWSLAEQGRAARIAAALDNYAVSTGRKIFRLSAALENIPVHEHPTVDELSQALAITNGRYELLPNAMIKRNS